MVPNKALSLSLSLSTFHDPSTPLSPNWSNSWCTWGQWDVYEGFRRGTYEEALLALKACMFSRTNPCLQTMYVYTYKSCVTCVCVTTRISTFSISTFITYADMIRSTDIYKSDVFNTHTRTHTHTHTHTHARTRAVPWRVCAYSSVCVCVCVHVCLCLCVCVCYLNIMGSEGEWKGI